MNGAFEFTGRIRSIRNAARGIRVMVGTQHNAWVHAAATVAVCGAGLWFGISRSEWCLVVLAITAVWASEAINTALEFFADATAPEYQQLVRDSKDIAAGAVLLSAAGAVVLGLLVFGPHVAAVLW